MLVDKERKIWGLRSLRAAAVGKRLTFARRYPESVLHRDERR